MCKGITLLSKSNVRITSSPPWSRKNTYNDDFHHDLNWFLKFLPTFIGVSFVKLVPVETTIELDACLQGLGAVCNNQVYAVKILPNFQNYTIVQVAVRVWKYYWKQ